jgi:beta-glucosidase
VDADGCLTATIDVTNIGSRPGEEVVQFYVGCEDSKVERAKKELKDFAKVSLDPGQTKSVPLRLSVRDTAYYDVGSASWQVEKTKYKIYVGPSSDEGGLLTDTFRVI